MVNITTPPEALEAVKQKLYPHLTTESDDIAFDISRAACLAMLEAWPRMMLKLDGRYALLPLPQENTNAEG